MGKARKRSHGHGTVFVRPNGRFTAQITNGGDRRSIGTFATRKAAELALAAALVEGPPTALEMTFREYLTDWLADRPLTVKPTTTARDRNVVTRYVLPHPIARRLVRDLEPKDFRALYRFLAASGKEDGTGLAPGTIKTVEQVLRGALQQLVDDRDLPLHTMPHRAVKTIVTERPHLNTDQLRGLIRFATFRYPDLRGERRWPRSIIRVSECRIASAAILRFVPAVTRFVANECLKQCNDNPLGRIGRIPAPS